MVSKFLDKERVADYLTTMVDELRKDLGGEPHDAHKNRAFIEGKIAFACHIMEEFRNGSFERVRNV